MQVQELEQEQEELELALHQVESQERRPQVLLRLPLSPACLLLRPLSLPSAPVVRSASHSCPLLLPL